MGDEALLLTRKIGSDIGIQQKRQRVLLITTNVGSLFGDKAFGLRTYWLDQMCETVRKAAPIFVAIHLQESGGKNYRLHSKEMPGLVKELQQQMKEQDFLFARSFLDIEHELVEEFTALSSLYFVHRSAICNASIYHFRNRKFVPIADQMVAPDTNSLTITATALNRSGFARKEKFPRDFWTTFRWSRKGFLHTRWMVGTKILDLINIHMFHDESNLNFLENPTEYSNNRQRALRHALNRFEELNGGTLEGDSHCFLFGDFNFRLNLATFVKRLTSQTREREIVLMGGKKPRGGHSVSGSSSSCGENVSSSCLSRADDNSEDSGLARTNESISPAPVADRCLLGCYGDDGNDQQQDGHTTSSSDEEAPDEPRNSSRQHGGGKTASVMRRKNSVIEYFRPPPISRQLQLDPLNNGTKHTKTEEVDNSTDWVLRIGKKRFEYCNSNWLQNEWKEYAKDDWEPRQYPLKELRLSFPPTYPWSEEPNCPNKFMGTRAPAWCDRVMFNQRALGLVERDPDCEYRSFGWEKCIGDHKPVMLLFSL